MNRFILFLLTAVIGVCNACGDKPSATDTWIDSQLSNLVETYHWLHLNPEISFEEEKTAAKIADLWQADGYEVTTGVGGHGIVGILSNGDGPIVMLRTDLDALPVTEQTQLPYASTKRVELSSGGRIGVDVGTGVNIAWS